MTRPLQKTGLSRSEQISSADVNDAPEKPAVRTPRLLDSSSKADHHSRAATALPQTQPAPKGMCSRMTTNLTQKGGLSELEVITAAAQLVWHPNLRLHKITRCPNGYVAFSLVPAEIDDAGKVHPTDPAIVTVMDVDPGRAMSRAIDKALAQIEHSQSPLSNILDFAKRR